MPRMDLGLHPILTMTMTEPTCDVPRAAEIMNVHENTVYDLIEACELPAAKLGRGWVMLTQDVLRLVTEAIRAQTAARIKAKGDGQGSRRTRATRASRPGQTPEGLRSA